MRGRSVSKAYKRNKAIIARNTVRIIAALGESFDIPEFFSSRMLG